MATGVIQLHLSRSGTNTTQLLGSVFLRAPPISSQFRLICVLLCTWSGSAYPGGGQGSPRATSGLRGLSLGQWQTSAWLRLEKLFRGDLEYARELRPLHSGGGNWGTDMLPIPRKIPIE